MIRTIAQQFRVLHPVRPEEIQIWSYCYVDKDAPQDIKNALRVASIRAHSPAGTFEQDDMDNWQECTSTTRGFVSRSMDLNNQMGLGHEAYDELLGAWTSDHAMSESNHRAFYRRWAELMA
jgi:hypothetical protein